jgi:hypothetical protein
MGFESHRARQLTTRAIDVWVGETFAEEFRNTSEEAARRLITFGAEG